MTPFRHWIKALRDMTAAQTWNWQKSSAVSRAPYRIMASVYPFFLITAASRSYRKKLETQEPGLWVMFHKKQVCDPLRWKATLTCSWKSQIAPIAPFPVNIPKPVGIFKQQEVSLHTAKYQETKHKCYKLAETFQATPIGSTRAQWAQGFLPLAQEVLNQMLE